MYEIKHVIRDGEKIHKLKCPDCLVWGAIDEDQFNGRVSILCDCGFHQTINFNTYLGD